MLGREVLGAWLLQLRNVHHERFVEDRLIRCKLQQDIRSNLERSALLVLSAQERCNAPERGADAAAWRAALLPVALQRRHAASAQRCRTSSSEAFLFGGRQAWPACFRLSGRHSDAVLLCCRTELLLWPFRRRSFLGTLILIGDARRVGRNTQSTTDPFRSIAALNVTFSNSQATRILGGESVDVHPPPQTTPTIANVHTVQSEIISVVSTIDRKH